MNFSVGSPSLSLTSAGGQAVFPLVLEDGLYSFLAEPIHPNDDRYHSLARFDMTTNSQQEDRPTLDVPGAALRHSLLLD